MFESLDRLGARFRRGQLGLVVAGPGTGKSAFQLNYSLRSGTPTMYFSADSDAFTQLVRSVSILTGIRQDEVEDMVIEDVLPEHAVSLLTGLPIRFNYSASPSLTTIERSMEAYDELHGDFPALVVVDNITNVQNDMGDGADPFSGLEGLMDYLHDMARETEACVVGLHHVLGEYNDGMKPIPLSGVKGQIGRVPELIFTLHRRPEDDYSVPKIGVSPVKVRGAKFDPSGNTFAELEFLGDRMLMRDPEPDGVQDYRRIMEEQNG